VISIEKVRLNREDFVSWLGKALSGAVAMPPASKSGKDKPTDVTLVAPKGGAKALPVVCIPQARMHDLFAFVSTYTKVRPFSAFFRVLPLELISVLERGDAVVENELSVAKCVAGAAMAEAWVASARNSDHPKNVFPLLLASLSSALGQAVLAGYDQNASDWILSEWTELRKQPGDPFRTQEIDGTSVAWRIMGSAVSSSKAPTGGGADLIVRFLSKAIARGTVDPAMLRIVAPLSDGINFETLIAASREERINSFNDVVSDLKRRGNRSLRSEFVAGLTLAIAGNGSFDLLRSAREFDGWLDGATTWFGICAALFNEGNLLTYGNSVGRRMVRDIMVREHAFEPPHADINSSEYRFLPFGEALQPTTHAPNSLDVELLPGVLSRVSIAAPQDGDRRRDEAKMLLRSLNEAGYLIDRARQVALNLVDGDRPSAPYQPARRGQPR
jgi:hypothetical protein